MDLFSLIRAPNPTKVKTRSRPRAPYELPLLTLIAPRVIEMDEPAAATDSSGVSSTIERSPLDFAHEAEASDRETAAPEMPPPEEVPTTTAPGTDQAVETVAVKPPAVRESRKRGVPADVSDPDPLAFADAPSPYPADVAQSSQGVAVTGDPESENVSSSAEVGSPGSVYRPEWGVTNGSPLDTPEACQDLVDHAAPSGYFFELRHMHNEDFLGQYNINLARQVAMGSQLRLRNKEPGSVAGERGRYEEGCRREECWVESRIGKNARLDALSVDFDEELYPHMLTAIAGRRWVIRHGLRLATMKCAESLEMRQAFADVVSTGIAKGMSEGLKHGVEHGHAQRTDDSGEDAPQFIRDLRHSSSQLTIPVYPEVRDPRNPWACKEEIKLADAIAANISRAEQKKRSRIGLALLLVDAATQTESDA
nr:hypothetical protein [Tanacetum cinerariifolium]